MGRLGDYFRRIGRHTTKQTGFSIDEEPASDVAGALKLCGWAVDREPVELEFLLDGESQGSLWCRIPRLDVHRARPQGYSSLTAGFEFEFPDDCLPHIGPGHLELRARFRTGAKVIWQWKGGRSDSAEPAALQNLRRFLRRVLAGDNSKDLLLRKPKAGARLWLHPVIETEGQYPYLLRALRKLDGLGAALAELNISVEPVTVLIESAFRKAEIEKLIELQKPIAASSVCILTKDDFSGWGKAGTGLGEQAARHLVLYCHEDADTRYVDLKQLIADYLALPTVTVLMPALYGGEQGLSGPPGSHLEDFSSFRSERENVPLLFATTVSGPVWLTTFEILASIVGPEVEARPSNGEESAEEGEPANALPDLDIPSGSFLYHWDLLQGVLSYSGRAAGLLAEEQRRAQLLVHAELGALKGAKEQRRVLVLIPDGRSPREASRGLLYQVIRFAEALRAEGQRVCLVEDVDTPWVKHIEGFVTLPFCLLEERVSEFRGAWVIASDWPTLRAANVIRYLADARVGFFAQNIASGFYNWSGREKREYCEWAYRGIFVPIVNCDWVVKELGRLNNYAVEKIRLDVAVNTEMFFPLPLERRPQSIVVLLGEGEGDRRRREELLIEALRLLHERVPDIHISLVVFGGKAAGAELLELANESYSSLSAADLARLYSGAELMVDFRPYFGLDVAPLEAMACGAVPVVADLSGSMEFAVDGEGACRVLEESAQSLADTVVNILASKEEMAGHREAALQKASQFAGVRPTGLLLSLDSKWEQLKRRLSSEHSKARKASVIVPVYCALDSTILCLRSLVAFAPEECELIVVNDCSDAGTSSWLRYFAEKHSRIKLIELAQNSGFVQACLAGFEAAQPENDIILLNSDVVLTKGALAALKRAAYSRFDVALASGLSTNSSHLQLDINAGDSLASAAAKLERLGEPCYPTVVTPEGQLLYIRRWALEKFGFFDPVFNRGFCEESDMCMRMYLNGADMVVAEDALIFHRRSASFGPDVRLEHYNKNRPVFDGRWGRYYARIYPAFLERDPLREIRKRSKALGAKLEAPKEPIPLEDLQEKFTRMPSRVGRRRGQCAVLAGSEVVFILPSVILGGGTLSVLQHVNEMLLRGVEARVISLKEPDIGNYPLLAPAIAVSPEQLFELDWSRQKVVATFWVTAYIVKGLLQRYPKLQGYYYVQDYEPWFYSHPEEFRTVKEAEESYELGLKCVAKTHFLKEIVEEKHKVSVEVITPGIDHGVFYPGDQQEHRGRPRVTAYYRPRTARRGGRESLELLRMLKRRLPEVDVHLFGESVDLPPEAQGIAEMRGRLLPDEVGKLYRESDVVLDMSYWHGFGRMGIEGMACGAVPVLSRSGGIDRYAEDEKNCLIVEHRDLDTALERMIFLLKERELRMKMRDAALARASEFTEAKATDDWLRVLGISSWGNSNG